MNYRHIFHAGNFADLLKHAVLLALLDLLTADRGPLTVIDTHAGAGVYDLAGDLARRTDEGGAVAVLLAEEAPPGPLASLKATVENLNEAGARVYPGSPHLIATRLRARDQLIACETRREEFESLREALRRPAGAFATREDGWETARRRTPRAPANVLVHIDPPYEAPDDGARAADAVRQVLGRNRGAVVAIWAPIKDLAGFDVLLSGLEDAARGCDLLLIEARLHPLDDPLRLNGCAVIIVNPPAELDAEAAIAAEWIAGAFGGPGAVGRASRIGRPARVGQRS
ncbi:MAG: 23S rRNA (adenine(2030)-N(6))-methyltransferase RlmJ [Caulobacteraceae bacterium]